MRSAASIDGNALAGFDSDALAYFSSASITDTTEMNAVNALIVNLKSNSLYTQFKRLWLRSPTSEAASLVDFISLGSSTNTSATWATTGFTYNGSSSFINTVTNLSALGLSATSVSYGVYLRSGTGGTPKYMCAVNGAVNSLPNFIRTNAGAVEFANGTLLAIPSATTFIVDGTYGYTGLFVGSCTSSSNRIIMNNATVGNTNTTNVSGGYPARPLYIGANNNNGTAASFMAMEECLAFIASPGFSSAEVSTLYTLIQTYQTNVIAGGRQR